MKNLALILATVSGFSFTALADYDLGQNQKVVKCFADDNMSWVLSADRSTVEFTVEGETLGPSDITRVDTDNATYVAYTTGEGTLRLDNAGDTFQFFGESDSGPVSCK